jgi:hypothetical protein
VSSTKFSRGRAPYDLRNSSARLPPGRLVCEPMAWRSEGSMFDHENLKRGIDFFYHLGKSGVAPCQVVTFTRLTTGSFMSPYPGS